MIPHAFFGTHTHIYIYAAPLTPPNHTNVGFDDTHGVFGLMYGVVCVQKPFGELLGSHSFARAD